MTDLNGFDTILGLGIGVGLAAASGLRVFVPLLVLSIASRAGYVHLSQGFDWIATTPATVAFGAATVLEIGAYYVPWLDNLLDTIAGPAAVVAGIVASASVLVDVPPLLKWSIAIVAGGAAAGAVQASTSVLRLKSTAVTGGLANPLLATAELVGSLVTSALAIVAPLIAILLIGFVVFIVYRFSRRLFRDSGAAPAAGASG
jgi:hypothetical protein